jgi:uncharacterized protein YjiS (DUF1127 family)
LLQRNAALTDRCHQSPSAPVGAPAQLSGIKAMFIVSFVGTIIRYARYRAQLVSFSKLDDHTLRDIGLSRGELRSAAWDITAHGA